MVIKILNCKSNANQICCDFLRIFDRKWRVLVIGWYLTDVLNKGLTLSSVIPLYLSMGSVFIFWRNTIVNFRASWFGSLELAFGLTSALAVLIVWLECLALVIFVYGVQSRYERESWLAGILEVIIQTFVLDPYYFCKSHSVPKPVVWQDTEISKLRQRFWGGSLYSFELR